MAGIPKMRGAAVAGVNQIMRANTMEELDELVRSHNKDQDRKHPNDDDGTQEAAAGGVHPSDDDDTTQKDGGDMSPSAKPKAGGSYPYSLDPVPSSIDFTKWTAPGGNRFSEYVHGDSPYTISPQMRKQSDEQARSRREHVKNAMKFAWGGYTKYAFGSDEVLPVSKTRNNNWGSMGTTLVDSLDTLWIMGLKEDFWKARDWVRDNLSFDSSHSVSVFETTIRSLGGLLSAYDWSQDPAFLDKAKILGAKLFHAFDEHDIPNGQVNLASGKGSNVAWAGSNVIISEAGTLQLEFRYLAKMTQETQYATKSEKVFEVFNKMSPPNGLFPYFVRNKSDPPTFANNKLTFGAMSDSLYEYMLKIWLQGGKTEPLYRNMYDKAMEGMHKELLQTSVPSKLMYIADKNNGVMDHKMDHLVCFMGGLLALGAYTDPLGLESERAQRDLKTAKVSYYWVESKMCVVELNGQSHTYSLLSAQTHKQALTYTCYQMYARMNTGISAEFVQFVSGKDFQIGRNAPHYLLRPEAFESFYILSHLTGDPVYREWGWECFSAIERYCKTDIAYGSLHDVSNVNGKPENKMESFFLAETLKYLFLLQDPDSEVDLVRILYNYVKLLLHPLMLNSPTDMNFSLAAQQTCI